MLAYRESEELANLGLQYMGNFLTSKEYAERDPTAVMHKDAYPSQHNNPAV